MQALNSGSGAETSFTVTEKFFDGLYVYFIGDTLTGWKVNRYDLNNNRTSAQGTTNKPTSLLDCQALSYS